MQPTLCSKCKKNIAVVFISKMNGDEIVNEGLCMKCAKECPADAIKVTNFLAEIDPNKCVKCGHCETVCPRKIIKPQD